MNNRKEFEQLCQAYGYSVDRVEGQNEGKYFNVHVDLFRVFWELAQTTAKNDIIHKVGELQVPSERGMDVWWNKAMDTVIETIEKM